MKITTMTLLPIITLLLGMMSIHAAHYYDPKAKEVIDITSCSEESDDDPPLVKKRKQARIATQGTESSPAEQGTLKQDPFYNWLEGLAHDADVMIPEPPSLYPEQLDLPPEMPTRQLPKLHHIKASKRPKCKFFRCDWPDCGKEFRFRYVLKIHAKVHSDERPYKCPECTSTFKWKVNLKGHIKTHSKEKPFQCLCGINFAHMAKLEKHQTKSCPFLKSVSKLQATK